MASAKEIKREKILIADDSEMNRAILADILGGDYEILEAADGAEAVKILQEQGHGISLLLLDINMPLLDGFQVLEAMNKSKLIESVPVIIISAENANVVAERAFNLGVTDYISRPFDAVIVRRRVQNTLNLYGKQKRLTELVEEQIVERQKNNAMMIVILSHIVEFRNEESGPHIQHIRIITELFLRALPSVAPQYNYTPEEIALIGTASSLHDIGKVSIPTEVLNKPGRLTPEEFSIMKTHSAIGAEMLEKLPMYKDEPLVKTAYQICRWHHERYDGRGYPDGLKGDEIPMPAQVVALADVYDALTSERVYKKAIPHEKAVEMIKNGECGSFNPILLKVLDKVSDELYEKLHNPDTSDDDEDMHKIAAEVMKQKQITASSRTLSLIERERKKFQFFAGLSDGLIFELTYTPYMITFMNDGAKRLGVKDIVLNPDKDEVFLKNCGLENIKEITRILRSTTPEKATVEYVGNTMFDGEVRKCKLIAYAMWSDDEVPELLGAVGKIYQI